MFTNTQTDSYFHYCHNTTNRCWQCITS